LFLALRKTTRFPRLTRAAISPENFLACLNTRLVVSEQLS
jgi:hypothetical protein